IQAYGKFRIIPKNMNIDLLSASGHKIHGPKGVGFLYIKDKTKIRPITFGGGQQKDMRSGTINAPGIAGMGMAAKEIYGNLDETVNRMYDLKEYFAGKLSALEDVTINGKTGRDSAPHIVSASFPGVRSEVLLHALEEKGIYVSAGSACASNHPATSTTLLAIGLDRQHQESTLRFSFSVHTTREELDYTVEELAKLLPVLRKYRRF
ncbi:MAG: aminotransferase class V-fold PLP-dependent enzyme, partial [Clostridiales bacterium]|nr:aminotransferase class V-fold PLP-dependent enzyme [Clostridiales bacterium]